MAAHEIITTITVREAKRVAERLASRGVSRFCTDTLEQRNDLLLAARAIRAMARHLSDCDVLDLDGGGS